MSGISDILEIIDSGLFTPEEQLELVKYIDSRLEQIELLLYRMERLALQASDPRMLDSERARLQEQVTKMEDEIDRVCEQLPRMYLVPRKREDSEGAPSH